MKRKQAKKKPPKRQMKSYYTTGAKNIEVPNQLGTKRKGIVSQPTSEETTYFTFSEMQISPLSNYFKLFKKGQILTARALHHQQKKYNICHESGQNLPWFKFIFLLLGDGKEYENVFLRKHILRSEPLYLIVIINN